MNRSLEVVSVSLGSARRDHEVTVERGGVTFHVARRGTDGDLHRAEHMIQTLDGTVDAIGLGGIDISLRVRDCVYVLADGVRLQTAAKVTPVVDGAGVKDTLERSAVTRLVADGVLAPGTSVLCVSALDRFGMAEALAEAGCKVVYGDLMFAAGIPYPVTTADELAELAKKLLPQLGKLPFHMFYPTGDEQNRPPDPRFASYYEEAEVVAGDFHFIRRYLPERLHGKTVLTNTTTAEDVALLTERGATRLVTTTPVLSGRTFGTNVVEAMARAYAFGREEPSGNALADVLQTLAIAPEVRVLS